MPEELSDRELIKNCCNEERAAQKQLYQLYAGKMLVVALRYTKSKVEAEDVLQDSFVKVFRNISKFDFNAKLDTWITRIVINTALNSLRKKRFYFDELENNDIVDEDLPLSKYHFKELIGFIQQLPTGCQAVFNMYAIEGYTHKEIGSILEISEGTSKSQYARAKQLLKAQLLNEERRIYGS